MTFLRVTDDRATRVPISPQREQTFNSADQLKVTMFNVGKEVTERKHLPPADVAMAGGWRSVKTLDIYAQPDDETVLAVMNEPRKLREAHGQG